MLTISVSSFSLPLLGTFFLYLNCLSLRPRKRIDVQERRVAACFPQRCVLVPEVRPTRHSKDTRISRIRRLLATPSTSYLHNPPLCHTNTRTHLRARTPQYSLPVPNISAAGSDNFRGRRGMDKAWCIELGA
ncbi:hypothetical protein V8E53_003075 [Lactarius tabidus]